MLTKEKEQYLSNIFYSPSSSVSFYSAEKLYDIVKGSGENITRREIEYWLSKQRIYTQNKPVIRKFKRQKVIAPYVDYQYDADVAYMDSFPDFNKGYKYFLLIIDLMSRFVWTVPLKSLKGVEVLQAFKHIFETNRKPLKLRTDKGVEFVNKKVKAYLEKENIQHFVTQNEVKANYAERAIKTIRGRLMKYLKSRKTKIWIDELENITKSYNNTKHRSINKTPSEVTRTDEYDIWEQNYSPKSEDYYKSRIKSILKTDNETFRYNIGDVVKISNLRRVFDKEYGSRWTIETFRIINRKIKQGIDIYYLKDELNELIEGSFYSNELQKVVVNEDEEYDIEKIIRKRKRNNIKEILVKWVGLPSKFNSWISEESVHKYQDES